MKVNDLIQINPGLDIYDTVYAATTWASTVVTAASTAAIAAGVSSRGIGEVIAINEYWIQIKWLKDDGYGWLHYREDIEQSFKIVEDNSIIGILYK